MAELLSREKELVKINDKLDQMSTNVFDKETTYIYPNVHGGRTLMKTSTYLPNNNSFRTYTKRKGTTTLLKQLGAGDHELDQKERSDKTFTRNNTNTNNNAKNTSNNNNNRGTLTKSTANGTKNSLHATNNNFNTATFVKYRNPNFRESNSLDQLIENEKVDTEQPSEEMKKKSVTSVINGSMKRLNMNNYIKYLKTQVVMYQTDNERMKIEMSKQSQTLESTLERNQHAESKRDQAVLLSNQMSEKVRSLEHQIEDLTRSNKELSQEQTNKQREYESTKRDLRLLRQTNNNLENRLLRAQEETEAARSTITKMKTSERELREATRCKLEAKDEHLKGLKRQRADLLNAYKKQLFMIDNLKRQNTCMEQSAVLGFGEKEFSKVLDWNSMK